MWHHERLGGGCAVDCVHAFSPVPCMGACLPLLLGSFSSFKNPSPAAVSARPYRLILILLSLLLLLMVLPCPCRSATACGWQAGRCDADEGLGTEQMCGLVGTVPCFLCLPL